MSLDIYFDFYFRSSFSLVQQLAADLSDRAIELHYSPIFSIKP
ncbi:hypothetical protein [Microcoleus sp. herbarium14]